MKILGIDLGTKRVGLAISDELELMAHPLETIQWKGTNSFVDFLKTIIKEKNISSIVIGIPYTLKGSNSEKTEEIFKIKNEIEEEIQIPIYEEDERLTTKLAEQTLIGVGKKPSKNRDIIDQVAATYILQSFLDRKSKR